MAVYTKMGDSGKTQMFDGSSCNKNSPQTEVIGAIDELTSACALASSLLAPEQGDLRRPLRRIQGLLYNFSAQLADPKQANLCDWAKETKRLEKEIDKHERLLPPLANFILPGQTPGASALHLARTICRRAERRYFALPGSRRLKASRNLAPFINRLSDWLFTMARVADASSGKPDRAWRPK